MFRGDAREAKMRALKKENLQLRQALIGGGATATDAGTSGAAGAAAGAAAAAGAGGGVSGGLSAAGVNFTRLV